MMNKICTPFLIVGFLLFSGQAFAEKAVEPVIQEEEPQEQVRWLGGEESQVAPEEMSTGLSVVIIGGSAFLMGFTGAGLGAVAAGECDSNGTGLSCIGHGMAEAGLGFLGGIGAGVLFGCGITDFAYRTDELWIGTLSGFGLGVVSVLAGGALDSPGWGLVGGASAVILGTTLGYGFSEPLESSTTAWVPTLALDGEGGGQVGVLTRW